MKYLIAPDSLKGSISSLEIVSLFDEDTIKAPLADGGEGSLDVLYQVFNYEKVFVETKDAFGSHIESFYLLDNKTAYIETANVCGLKNRKDIYNSTSFGLGVLIKDAMKKGVEEIYLFLGGSATNDAGMGLLEGLGFDFGVKAKTSNLDKAASFTKPDNLNEDIKFKLITDVNNPLLGKIGASYIYGPQKGAKEDDLEKLDNKVSKYYDLISQNKKHHLQKGTGAAGGIPISIMSFFDTEIISGIKYFVDKLDIENKIKEADIIITGEGKIDSQSFYGKTISYIIELCKKHHKDFILICGVMDIDYEDKNLLGVYALKNYALDHEDPIIDAKKILKRVIDKISKY